MKWVVGAGLFSGKTMQIVNKVQLTIDKIDFPYLLLLTSEAVQSNSIHLFQNDLNLFDELLAKESMKPKFMSFF